MHACTCIRNFLLLFATLTISNVTEPHVQRTSLDEPSQFTAAQLCSIYRSYTNLPLTHHPCVVRKFCRREFTVCSLIVVCRHEITFWLLGEHEQLTYIISSRKTQILAEGIRSYRHSDSVSTEHRNLSNRRLLSHNLASCFAVSIRAGDDEDDENCKNEERPVEFGWLVQSPP